MQELIAAIQANKYKPIKGKCSITSDVDTQITVTDIKNLIAALRQNGHLPSDSENLITALDFSNCGDVDAQGAIIIAKSLSTLPQITNLNLANNNIGDKGIEAFAQVMADNKTLLSLNLSNTFLLKPPRYNDNLNNCLINLTIAISKNQKLKVINLSKNWQEGCRPEYFATHLLTGDWGGYSKSKTNRHLSEIYLNDDCG